MGELSAESFADWLPPNEVIDYYISQRDPDPKGRTIVMLCDGLLRAAAAQLIINGEDKGLALIPAKIWDLIADSDVWSTGRFRLMLTLNGKAWSASGYDVRVDREIQTPLSAKADTAEDVPDQPLAKRPLPDRRFKAWLVLFLAANPNPTEDMARASLNLLFPDNTVTRDRLREALPDRRKGRPVKNQGTK